MAPGQCRCQWHGAHLPWFCSVRVQLGRSPPCRLRGSESVGRIVSAWAGSFFTAKCLQSWVRLRNPVIRAIRPGPGSAALRPGALAAAHQTPPGKPQPAHLARVRVIRTAAVPVTVTITRVTGPGLRHTTSPSESAPRPTEPPGRLGATGRPVAGQSVTYQASRMHATRPGRARSARGLVGLAARVRPSRLSSCRTEPGLRAAPVRRVRALPTGWAGGGETAGPAAAKPAGCKRRPGALRNLGKRRVRPSRPSGPRVRRLDHGRGLRPVPVPDQLSRTVKATLSPRDSLFPPPPPLTRSRSTYIPTYLALSFSLILSGSLASSSVTPRHGVREPPLRTRPRLQSNLLSKSTSRV